ncbi:hypothetical protein MRB53_030764 [Persea americana]|nr:hypothetical protein MRB53_030764 [Persea americana]
MAQHRFSSSTLIAVFLVAFLLFSVPSSGEMNVRATVPVPTGNCIGKCSDFADCNQECINHGNTKGQCQENDCCCIQ